MHFGCSGRRVGVDKIRELRGVMAAKDIRRGQFATTSTFTPKAAAFAGTGEGNRSVVGKMSEFAFLAEAYRDEMKATDLLMLSVRLADTPCGVLKHD